MSAVALDSTAEACPASLAAAQELQPLTTAELIDRCFQLYRRHFLALVLFSGLINLPAHGLGASLVSIQGQAPSLAALLVLLAGFFGMLCLFLLKQVGQLAMTVYIARLYLGAAASFWESFKLVGRRWIRVTITLFIYDVLLLFALAFFFLCTFFVGFIVLGPAGPGPGLATIALVVLVGILALVPALILFLRLVETNQAMMLDRLWGVDALWRSNELASYDPKMGFWYWGGVRLSVLLLVVFAVSLLLSLLANVPHLIGLGANAARGLSGPAIMMEVPDYLVLLTHLLGFVAEVLVGPLFVLVTTIYYYDVRVRKEGYDIELLAEMMWRERGGTCALQGSNL